MRPPPERTTQKIIKYIPLQQGLRHCSCHNFYFLFIIKYIPLQQGLRLQLIHLQLMLHEIIKYIPLQQGLRHECRYLPL